jgi:HAD superfamily phosphoserine phosphatase-like hydrolase
MTASPTTRFASVVIDVDSTLSAIEGLEWLSTRRTSDVQARIVQTTEQAMRGDVPLEAVYGERLSLVQPTQQEVGMLANAYIAAIAPGARETIGQLRCSGVRVVLISGGLREAIVPLAASVGLTETDVNAVSIRFDATGHYLAYDTTSPLARRGGKPEVVQSLHLPAPILALGDGITDAELKPVVDTFAAFVGFASHERVIQAADMIITSFSELPLLVLP